MGKVTRWCLSSLHPFPLCPKAKKHLGHFSLWKQQGGHPEVCPPVERLNPLSYFYCKSSERQHAVCLKPLSPQTHPCFEVVVVFIVVVILCVNECIWTNMKLSTVLYGLFFSQQTAFNVNQSKIKDQPINQLAYRPINYLFESLHKYKICSAFILLNINTSCCCFLSSTILY